MIDWGSFFFAALALKSVPEDESGTVQVGFGKKRGHVTGTCPPFFPFAASIGQIARKAFFTKSKRSFASLEDDVVVF